MKKVKHTNTVAIFPSLYITTVLPLINEILSLVSFTLIVATVLQKEDNLGFMLKKVTQIERKRGTVENTNHSQVLTLKLFNPTR